MQAAPGSLLNIAGNAVSCSACLCLLWKFYHTAVIVRAQNFFSILFRSMATADVLFHLGLVNYAAFGLCFGSWPQDPGTEAWACGAAGAVFATARAISVLHELAIAVYVLCAAFQCRALLLGLGKSIPLLWLTGLALGVTSVFLNPWRGGPEESACRHKPIDLLTFLLILVCFGLSAAAYVCVAVRAAYWELALRRPFVRLAIYPLIFFFVYAAIMIVYSVPGLYRPGPVLVAADFMESLNGLLNVVVYWWQSHSVAHLQFFGVAIGMEILSSASSVQNGPSSHGVADGLTIWARRLEAMTREHEAVESYILRHQSSDSGGSSNYQMEHGGAEGPLPRRQPLRSSPELLQ